VPCTCISNASRETRGSFHVHCPAPARRPGRRAGASAHRNQNSIADLRTALDHFIAGADFHQRVRAFSPYVRAGSQTVAGADSRLSSWESVRVRARLKLFVQQFRMPVRAATAGAKQIAFQDDLRRGCRDSCRVLPGTLAQAHTADLGSTVPDTPASFQVEHGACTVAEQVRLYQPLCRVAS
jgi:hypothetical protein